MHFSYKSFGVKSICTGLGIGLAFGFAALFSATASAETLILKYSNWLPAGYHVLEGVAKPWIADVERVTEGRVKIEILPKVVGTVPGQYDVLADGLVDVSLFTPSFSAGRFPLIGGFELPLLGNDPVRRSVGTWRLYQKYLADSSTFDQVHLVSIFSSNSSHTMTTGAQINSPQDYKGLKLRTSSPSLTMAVDLLGGVPVLKPISELYELASGGVVDGALIPFDTVKAFKLDEIFKYVSYIDEGGLGNSMVVIAMSKAAWDKISPEDQAAISEISGEYLARRNGEVLKDKMDSSINELKAAGMNIHEAPSELVEEMKKIVQPVIDEWIKSAKENGLENPEQFLKELSAETGGSL